MKIKVCGMKYPDNIEHLSLIPIDYMGFIFYPKSLRYIDKILPETILSQTKDILRVGVFVNEKIELIFSRIEKYKLDVIQLHGSEHPKYCSDLLRSFPNIKIIKAFSISSPNDLHSTKEYNSVCDFFLFDTKSTQYGGSGKKFDWSLMDFYAGELPFFLSGGISMEDVGKIKEIKHPKLYGLDLNSKFEIEPGRKNIELIKEFIEEINYE
ncbi:phosphoribosylanthranilate isomerase [Apibacter sp. wkB309]|uniref:phosphoribosylanthranilate isomerase n=1 Tax=Apibacter sp. wkB309 TaxID=1679467 RepID=UPI000CFA1C5B|nr:phosphoribosylanthranilate isomerase [Apibacter sp. wkB309]PQL92944.1 N-(5'-phosphoribosyl)anthranilate isomerase [Apibacter sp. wkB309]